MPQFYQLLLFLCYLQISIKKQNFSNVTINLFVNKILQNLQNRMHFNRNNLT